MVSPVRVWLNRTYAENVFFMDQLRRNPADRAVEIHATHGDPDSPVLAAADTADLEPEGLSAAGTWSSRWTSAHGAASTSSSPGCTRRRSSPTARSSRRRARPCWRRARGGGRLPGQGDRLRAVRAIGVPVPPWCGCARPTNWWPPSRSWRHTATGRASNRRPGGRRGLPDGHPGPFSLTHLNGFPSPSVVPGRGGAAGGGGTRRLAGDARGWRSRRCRWTCSPVRTAGYGWPWAAPRTAAVAASPSTSGGWVPPGASPRRSGCTTCPMCSSGCTGTGRPDGRQHPARRRAAPAGTVRDQRAVGGGPPRPRGRSGRADTAVPGPGLLGGGRPAPPAPGPRTPPRPDLDSRPSPPTRWRRPAAPTVTAAADGLAAAAAPDPAAGLPRRRGARESERHPGAHGPAVRRPGDGDPAAQRRGSGGRTEAWRATSGTPGPDGPPCTPRPGAVRR